MEAVASLYRSTSETQLDDEFVREFQAAAMRWAMHAAIAGALLFSIFMLVAYVGERASDAAQLIRAFFVVYFVVLAVCLWRRVVVTESNYVLVAAATSVMSLVGTILILRVQFEDVDSAVVLRSTPAVICGLFMMYAFLRLPLWVSLGIGICVSAVAVLWAPVVSGGAETVRSMVYLIFTNVLGALIAKLIELRERELFLERRRAEEAQLVASQKSAVAVEASRDKTRLVAAISHDLRQPMLAAVTHLDVLRSRLRKGDLQGAATQAERAQCAVDILGSTLDQLLTAAQYDNGQELVRIEEVGLAKIMREALDLSLAEAERRGVGIRVRVPSHYVGLATDSRSIRRVLDNLLSNAVKFATVQPGGIEDVVLFAARLRAGYCEIDVIDRGPGIPAAKLEEIWRPYSRFGAAERDRARGLGLGLFLVRTVVDQLPRHSVRVSSREGFGTRFTVKVPVATQEASPMLPLSVRPETSAGTEFSLSELVIVLIEDDRDARIALMDLLETHGATVHASPLAEEVLLACKSDARPIDAIVCDYSLASGTRGTDTIRELRLKLGYSPPAILITGNPEAEALLNGVAGDICVLKKPFAPQALLSALARG